MNIKILVGSAVCSLLKIHCIIFKSFPRVSNVLRSLSVRLVANFLAGLFSKRKNFQALLNPFLGFSFFKRKLAVCG